MMILSLLFFVGSYGSYETPIHSIESLSLLTNTEPAALLLPPHREVPAEYRDLFQESAASAGIPPEVLESIVFVESEFIAGALSPVREGGYRDLGICQFNSRYLGWYAEQYNGGVSFDPMSPEEAVPIAAQHIRFLWERYSHWPTVCLAYNAGMGAVDKDEIPDRSYRYLVKVYKE
jgi:soluble lytic murein transglycosylase-like protein